MPCRRASAAACPGGVRHQPDREDRGQTRTEDQSNDEHPENAFQVIASISPSLSGARSAHRFFGPDLRRLGLTDIGGDHRVRRGVPIGVDIRVVDLLLPSTPQHVERRGHQDPEDDDVAQQQGAEPGDTMRDPERQRAHQAGGRQGEQPRHRHSSGHRPTHLSACLANAAAEDRPGRHVGGRQRHAGGAGAQDDYGRRRRGREPLRRLDLHQALSEGADDPPAPDVGAETDRQRAAAQDPERQPVLLDVSAEMPGGDQREGDHAHGLLRVVCAVRQRDQRGRGDLAPAESFFAALFQYLPRDPVHQPSAARGDDARDDRCGDCRDEHLLGDTAPVDAGRPDRREPGADQPTEQRVRRARRDAEQPGEQVPQDAADEPGEDDRESHGRVDRRQ